MLTHRHFILAGLHRNAAGLSHQFLFRQPMNGPESNLARMQTIERICGHGLTSSSSSHQANKQSENGSGQVEQRQQEQQSKSLESNETTKNTKHSRANIDVNFDPNSPFNWEPTPMQRLNLVILGFYKSRDQVPAQISHQLYDRYNSRFRAFQLLFFSSFFAIMVIIPQFMVASRMKKAAREPLTRPRFEEAMVQRAPEEQSVSPRE